MHATQRSRFRMPWLIVAFAALGVMALAVGVVRFGPSSCPSAHRPTFPPGPPTLDAGTAMAVLAAGDPGPALAVAFYYDPARAEDRCSLAPLARDGWYASLPSGQYRGGALCGAYLNITGPLGTVQAEVVDTCPGCAANQVDLSVAAFTQTQRPAAGTARISYVLAHDPALPGPLAVRVGPGSTATSLTVQVVNHGNALASVAINGKALSLRADGYWIAPGGAGPGPYQVSVADQDGHTALLTGIVLRPGALQQTGTLMYGGTTPSQPQPSPAPAPAPAPPASTAARSSLGGATSAGAGTTARSSC